MEHPATQRVAITAAGVVSPIGFGLSENGAALRSGNEAVSPVLRFDVSGCRARSAAQVHPEGLAGWIVSGGFPFPAGRREVHHASAMLLAAAGELAAGDPGSRPEAMVLGTTGGGMTFGEAFYRESVNGRASARSAANLWGYPPQTIPLELCGAHGFDLPFQVVANACASGTNAIGHAFQLVRSGLRQSVWCGGFDALSELVFVGFDTLRATTEERCRPFDIRRSGLLLGEGAALLALERMDAALARRAPILGEVLGYGVSTDNHHLTQPHPSGIGPRLAMERALRSAGLDAGGVDAINAHGTATPHNDASEGAALSALFPGKPVASTKGMTGHALGAAGAIEAVFSLLSIRGSFLPPNVGILEPEPGWAFEVVRSSRSARVARVLSNSFGFGGSNASIILAEAAP